jgi:hypothetical protein
MKRTARYILSFILMALILMAVTLSARSVYAAMPAPGEPGAVDDPRYCGEPARDAHGVIKRSRKVLRQFTAVFPCPATLAPTAACVGWAVNHTIPLASGGCDSVANMTWMPDAIKSCADPHCEDRWERKYHAIPRQVITFPSPVVPDVTGTAP